MTSHISLYRAARLLAITFGMAVFAQSGFAATKVFDGGGPGNDWSTGANWLPGSEPTSADRAIILFGHTVEVTNSGESARGIDVSAGGTLDLLGGGLSFQAEGFRLGDGSLGIVEHSAGILIGSGPGSSLLVGSHGEYHMSGGSIDLDENLEIAPGGIFQIWGSDASISVEGDWIFQLGAGSSWLQIKLVGDVVPEMHVTGDLHLNDSIILDLDASLWTGGSTVELFDVADDILGSFSQVFVNGVAASNVQIGSGSVSVEVPEPHALVLMALGVLIAAVFSGAALFR